MPVFGKVTLEQRGHVSSPTPPSSGSHHRMGPPNCYPCWPFLPTPLLLHMHIASLEPERINSQTGVGVAARPGAAQKVEQ